MPCQVCQEPMQLKRRFTDIIFLKKDEHPICQSCTQRFEYIDSEHCPNAIKIKEENLV